MIIEAIASNRRNLIWTIFHIVLGFICVITPFALIVWFYFILLSNFPKAISLLKSKKPVFFLILFSYLNSFEVLDRMAKTSPIIPYELSKYLLVLMGVLGLVNLGMRSLNGLWMALLITPALFYDFSSMRQFADVINSYFAPLAVCLGLAFGSQLVVKNEQFIQILKLIWLGCLSSLVFTIIKTPDFDDIQFDLGANFDTTGGHASNQVSTILGLGMFLTFYSCLKRLNFSGNFLFDLIIMLIFAFQGLLTFSRGGMLVGALGVLILLLFPERRNQSTSIVSRKNFIFIGAIIIFLFYGIFEITNTITGGNLLLRYQGETKGTLVGTKEVTANHFVTGRIEIFTKDIDLWLKHPLTGVGCGVSPYIRDPEMGKIASHIELSRLLAEHGILGLLFVIFFFIHIPWRSWLLNKGISQRKLLIVLLLIAILTTFHAAMRTFVTPLFIILGSLKVIDSNIDVGTQKITGVY